MLTRSDYSFMALSAAGALVNGWLGWLSWPSAWAAISLVCAGWCTAAAAGQVLYAQLRAMYQANTAEILAEANKLFAADPETIERGRVMTEMMMQQTIDSVLAHLKEDGKLEPGVEVRVKLGAEGEISTGARLH